MLRITPAGLAQLQTVFVGLQKILSPDRSCFEYQGKVKSGMGEGRYYIQVPKYLTQFKQKLGFSPYGGTLNLELDPLLYQRLEEDLKEVPPVEIEGFSESGRTFGPVKCVRAEIFAAKNRNVVVPCALLQIQRTSHRPTIVEIIAEQYLRGTFKLKDHDELVFRLKR